MSRPLVALLAVMSTGMGAGVAAAAPTATLPQFGAPMIPAGTQPAGAQPAGATIPSYSLNWSGYAVASSTPFTQVSSVFVQPTVTCPGVRGQLTSDWVGLDGLDNSTVEQDGTGVECGGPNYTTPLYYAWYEMYPAGSVLTFPVNPGDVISASVVYSDGTFTLSIADLTTGASYTDNATCASCERTSAEWIIERPAFCNDSETKCALTALADFDTSSLVDAKATLQGGTAEPISAFKNYALDMVDPLKTGGFVTLDTVGDLSSTGSSFTATWDRSGKPTPIQL